MKKIAILITILIPSILSAQITCTIKGHIADWKGQDSIRLSCVIDNKIVIDSTMATDGRFSFTKTLIQPVEAYVSMVRAGASRRDNTRIYLEHGTVYINGKDSLSNAAVKGNGLNEDFQLYNKNIKKVVERLVELRTQAMKTTTEERTQPAFKALEQEYAALQDSLTSIRKTFIVAHPNSFMSLEVTRSLTGLALSYEKVWPYYSSLSPEVRNTPLGIEFGKKLAIAKTTGIGVKLASFTSYDTAHNTLKLEDVLKTGKVTMIDFWASWCKPCRAENPNVVKAYNAFHTKGFNIISVSLDKTAQSWKDAIIKDGMPWYHVSSLQYWQEPVALQYGIEGVPDNLLIDAEGKVIARGLRGEALYKKLESLLN